MFISYTSITEVVQFLTLSRLFRNIAEQNRLQSFLYLYRAQFSF